VCQFAKRRTGLVIFALVLIVYLFSFNGVWATDHPSSFVQLDWAIWSGHTFAVKNSQVNTNPVFSMDDFPFNGAWYIASAPGSSLFSLPFAIPAFLLSGYTPFGYVLTFTEAFVSLMGAISAYLMYEISKLFFKRESTSIFLALALAFSSLLWPFATYFFQHDVSTAFVLLAFYLALKVSTNLRELGGESGGLDRGGWTRNRIFRSTETIMLASCGFAVAASILVDYVNTLLIPIVFVYLLYAFYGKTRISRVLLVFLSTAFVGVAGVLAYNLMAFGREFTSSQNMYDGKGLMADFTTPLYKGLFINFSSPYRGLFLYCPILILAPIGLYFMFRNRSDKSRILFGIAIAVSIVVPYSMWQDVTAGVSFGPRFLIPAIPFIFCPWARSWRETKGRTQSPTFCTGWE